MAVSSGTAPLQLTASLLDGVTAGNSVTIGDYVDNYGLVRMEPGEGRKLMPKVLHDRVELELPLLERRTAKGGRP